jgi:hypothetical protein
MILNTHSRCYQFPGESPDGESPDGEGSPGRKKSSGLGRKARKTAEMAKIRAHAAGEISRGPSKAERIAKEAERKSSTLKSEMRQVIQIHCSVTTN